MKLGFSSVVLASVLGLATATSAGTVLQIEDDGFAMVPASAPATFTVEIEDDGWTRVPAGLRSDRGLPQQSDCSALERTLGVDASACGTLGHGALARMKFDAETND